MLLVIDLGNTEITIGAFAATELQAHRRLTTVIDRTPDEWAATVAAHLTHAGLSAGDLRACIMASVAPAASESFASGVTTVIGISPTQVGPESPLPVVLDVEEPMQVGADRVVNTLAAAHLYGRDTIVVDFGTATTFDCITGQGHFLGGVIAPGLRTAADDLAQRAAKLPATELQPPNQVIGRRTEDCIRSGVLLGASEAVDGIVRRIRAEWPNPDAPYVVATGGLADKVVPLCREVDHTEPYLTLTGLRVAAGHLGLVR